MTELPVDDYVEALKSHSHELTEQLVIARTLLNIERRTSARLADQLEESSSRLAQLEATPGMPAAAGWPVPVPGPGETASFRVPGTPPPGQPDSP